ncbi:MAG TPA: enoyl-CoA hydratase-related protein [Steroidobacteraceae bacterium]|nr:enoyl-CoA hydratase-related protein [Steroidobacteraceae bacterium]
MSHIIVDDLDEGIKRITLNRPQQLNAFTFDMYAEFIGILRALERDSKTRVVILTGSGKGFCAGHDLKSAGAPPWIDDPDMGKAYAGKHSISEIGMIPSLIRHLPQPMICAVNGAAAGMGFALALAADLCVAARSAKFVNSVHNAGTGHELGMSYMLPRAIGTQRAAELLLTARPVLADEAERIGLVLKTVDDAVLMETAVELAKSIMVNVPIGIWLTKQSLWLNQNAGSLEAAIELENRAVAMAQSTVDAAEKRAAFLEKRVPKFTNR